MTNEALAVLPESVRGFRPRCPGCTPSAVTEPGARPCSAFDCSGLPKELEVTCDLCMYDFAAGDGQTKCDHRTCETALRLQANVPTYLAWIDLLKAEMGGGGARTTVAVPASRNLAT